MLGVTLKRKLRSDSHHRLVRGVRGRTVSTFAGVLHPSPQDGPRRTGQRWGTLALRSQCATALLLVNLLLAASGQDQAVAPGPLDESTQKPPGGSGLQIEQGTVAPTNSIQS